MRVLLTPAHFSFHVPSAPQREGLKEIMTTFPRIRTYENGLLVMLFMANGLMFFDRLAINFLMPSIRQEFGFGNGWVGALNAALGLAWACSGFLLGRHIDRRPVKRRFLVGAVIAFSVCSIGSGLATTFAALLFARLLMGAAEGPVLPATQALMVVESTTKRRGFNMGFIQAVSAGVFGQILAPVLIIPLAAALGWRSAFFLAGVPGLLLAVLLWFKVREPALERYAALHDALNDEPRAGTVADLRGQEPPKRNVGLCIVIACLFITTFFSVMVFGPLFLVEQRHLSTSQMAGFMTVLGFAAVAGGALVPALSDRVGRRPAVVGALLLASLAPLTIGYLDASLPLLCGAIFVSYLGVGCLSVILATIPAESVHGSRTSRTLALVMGVSEVVGGCVSPVLCGLAADRIGPAAPFAIGSTTALIAACLALFLRETAPQRRKSPPPRRAALDAPEGVLE